MQIRFSNISFASKDISQARRFVKYPIKVVFSDVDGTILNAKQQISNEHLFAIKKLEDANIPLVLATGRGYKAIDVLFENLKMKPQTTITESGAVIVDSAKNKLFENKLSLESVQKIRDAFKEFKAPEMYFRFTFDGDPYIEGSVKAFDTSTVKTYPIKSFDELLNKGLLPTRALIAKFDSKSFTDIELLLKKFRDFLGKGLNVFNSGSRYAEITNNTVSKANAIEFLQKHFGFDFKNVACIGDAENDVCMAEIVSKNGGMSVSMKNGMKEMKQASDFLTGDIDNGGFLKFVDEVLLINAKMAKKNI